MTSLARRMRARKLAARAAAEAGTATPGRAAPMPKTGESASEYRVLLAALHDDLRTLSEVQSITDRNPMKAEMAAKFLPWVKGALEAGAAGKAAQDEIVVTIMIWAIDYRDIDFALDIAAHVLKHGLTLPERYNRTAACLIAEELAEVYLREPGSVSAAQLARAALMTDGRDMPDQARAKISKAIGRASLAAAQGYDPGADNAVAGGKAGLLQAAIDAFKEAIRRHDKCGAKLDLKLAETELAKLGTPPGT